MSWGRIIAMLAVVSLVTYLVSVHRQAVDDAYAAGEKSQQQICTQEKLTAVETALQRSRTIQQEDEKILLEGRDQAERQAARYKQLFEESRAHATDAQKNHSVCNPSVSGIRLLNEPARDYLGLPENPGIDEATAASPSTVTGEALREWAQSCTSQYHHLAGEYIKLTRMIELRESQ